MLVTDGRSNAGEDPLRAAEAAARQNIPIFPIAAGAEEGPAERPARRGRGQPGRLRPRPDDPGRRRRGPRAASDAEATLVLEQRVNDGDWEPVGNQRVALGEDGILKRTTFRITPKVVGQYEFRARVEDAGPGADARTTTSRPPRCGSSASRSAS